MSPRRSVACRLFELNVVRQHEILVDWESGSVSVQQWKGPEAVIRFRVLKPKSPVVRQSGRVILYACGGAFMFPSTGAAESVYLKDLTHELRDVGPVVVSVCLPTGAFPVAMQVLLDTYLWLTSDDPRVAEVLGFGPKEFVFCGDSSGGNQVLSLLVLINELGVSVRPESVVLFFPKTSLQRDVFPSLLMSQFDAFAHSSFLSAACLTYVPIVRKDQSDGTLTRVHNSQDLGLGVVTDPDYQLIESFILSPIRYNKLHQLSRTSLLILAVENDPLLDESIQLAKRWHGPVEVRVVESVPHGILLFHHMTKRGHKCLKLAADLMRRAFTDLK